MRIISLDSDFLGFKKITFKEKGISLIAGTEKQENNKSTYNGVGKTLALVLIDFCLGASFVKDLSKMNSNIYLEVDINGSRIIITRNTTTPNSVKIDNIVYTLNDFKKTIETKLKIENQKNISLRTLIPYFLRYRKSSFIDALSSYKTSKSKKIEYGSLINIFYLFGLNLDLVEAKNLNVKKLKYAVSTKKGLEDSEIKQLLISENTNLDIEYKITLQQIQEKRLLKENYNLADNHLQLKQELELNRQELEEISNDIFLLENNLKKIDVSLAERSDISFEEIKKFYGDMLKIFSKESVENLQNVSEFHNKMLDNRFKRLNTDKIKYNIEIEEKLAEKKKKVHIINDFYKILSNSNGLEEYDTLCNEIEMLQSKISKFENYKENIIRIKNQILDAKASIAKNNKLSENYLLSISKKIEELSNNFSNMVVDLYGSSCSGTIDIKNNDKNNQIQFEIEVKMKNDSSTGIGNSKILCFSTMLLTINEINVDFLIFDNKIFDGMASNQLANYFKSISYDQNPQYIFTISQNQLNELENKLGKEDYKRIISDNIVMDLNDDGDKGKLLGTTLEMNLEEK